MKTEVLITRIKKGTALGALMSFLLMQNTLVAVSMPTEITKGNSAVGGAMTITPDGQNITNITSGFVNNGTGVNHFNKLNVGAGHTANMLGADRYINMVDSRININGTLNAFKAGNLPANAMFISPEGMAVGAGGVLNVGGLQVITPSGSTYSGLVGKLGANGAELDTLDLKLSDFENAIADGNALVEINGEIYSTGDVVISAGNGIYFTNGGIIDTTETINGVSGIGDIGLFTNTGDIVGGSEVNIDSSGNLTLSAKNGGIGQGIVKEQSIYGEPKTVTPLNVKIAEGKKVNIDVSKTTAEEGSFKGYASVANNGLGNFNVGNVKGADIKIVNNGYGSIITTEKINDVNKIYFDGGKGALQVNNDIVAKEIIRLNADTKIDAAGNLTVTDNGYISLYSKDGSIDINDVSLNMGNIDIKAVNGDVSFGNVTIAQRGPAEGVLRLVDNQKLSTGIEAPDTYRFDGVHIESSNANIKQKANTQINSAGRVDLTAGKDVDVAVKSVDLISGHVDGVANVSTLNTARIGDFKAATLNMSGSDILIDGMVEGKKVNIVSTDKVTLRPNTYLDKDHRTYGAIKSVGDVNVTATNGIYAAEIRPEGPMITSNTGKINLSTNGDIKVLNSTDSRITVSAGDRVNANGDNVNLTFAQTDGKAGLIKAKNNANIGATDNLIISEKIEAGNNVIIAAVGNLVQSVEGASVMSGKDTSLKSSNGDIVLTVDVDGIAYAEATSGNIDVTAADSLNVGTAVAGKDVKLTSLNDILTVGSSQSGKNTVLNAGKDVYAPSIVVGGELYATAKNGEVVIGSAENLTIGQISAATDAKITGVKDIYQAGSKPAIKTGNNLKVTSKNGNVGASNNYLTVNVGGALDADALNGDVYIEGLGNLNYNKVQASRNVGLKAEGNLNQTGAFDINNPSVIAGKDMYLASSKGDVGNVNNPLSVKVGNALSADASQGNVYIGSNDNLVIGQIKAGKDVNIDSNGYIHQAVNAQRPAITAGKDLNLLSNTDNVGDPNNYLTVSVGDKLNAKAPNGGVYIYGYGDLTVNKIEAANNVGLGGNKNIIIPSDTAEGNIIAGGHVKIEAGDSVLNGGGTNLGIKADSLEVIANLNKKTVPGSVGVLPYNDLVHSINVIIKGDINADEVGVAETNKILNINRMDVITPSDNNDNIGLNTDDIDERDQRNLKYLTDDKDSASSRNFRQHLRYDVASSEYVVLNSNTDSGAKVQDVLNISKQGMLVQTNETPKIGENIQVTMDYKGLPFTIEGKVVRTDAVNKTAGVSFSNIDQFTSSMILYLGMMNGI